MKHHITFIFLLFGILIPASIILPENTTGMMMGIFVLVTIILLLRRQLNLKVSRHIYPFIVLFFLYVISLLYSDDTNEGKIKIFLKLPLLILPVIMSMYIAASTHEVRRKFLQNFVLVFACATPYFLLVALYRSLKNGSINYVHPESGEVLSTFFTYVGLSEWVIHPAYLSLWSGTAFIISIFIVSQNPKKLANWAVSFSLLILILLAQSRMNILAMAAALGCIGLVFLFRKYSFQKAVGILSVFVLMVVGIVVVLPDRFKGRFNDLTTFDYNIEAETFHEGFNGITIRLAEWKCALQEIRKRPLLGSGVGDARFHLEESYLRNNFKYGYREKFNAHNQFIETTLALGVTGLVALLSIFVTAFYRALVLRRWYAVVALAYIFLCFLTESYLERQWGVVFMGMIIPVLLESEIALQHDEQWTSDKL